jgi:hypothetical protein
LFPALVGLLSAKTGLGNAICILAVIANAAVFVTVLALPETRGRRLDDADHLIPAQQPESTSEKSLPHGT